jgi:hypothetical protein
MLFMSFPPTFFRFRGREGKGDGLNLKREVVLERWKGRDSIRRAKVGEKCGFALVAALLALWILTSVGLLVFAVSTQDVRISSRTVGEKSALSASDSCLHTLTQSFNWTNLSANAANITIDSAAGTTCTIQTPTLPTSGPGVVLYPGFSMGGGEVWGRARYLATVVAMNTRYNSRVQVDSGVGYGPVDITTIYR